MAIQSKGPSLFLRTLMPFLMSSILAEEVSRMSCSSCQVTKVVLHFNLQLSYLLSLGIPSWGRAHDVQQQEMRWMARMTSGMCPLIWSLQQSQCKQCAWGSLNPEVPPKQWSCGKSHGEQSKIVSTQHEPLLLTLTSTNWIYWRTCARTNSAPLLISTILLHNWQQKTEGHSVYMQKNDKRDGASN